jgi:NitT/TauT family transport system substrate-binding protein
VQELVDGIAGSGYWLDQSPEHRMEAAEVAGRHYYNQDPALLRFVLSKPPDRVKYTRLMPLAPDFDEIMRLAVETGMLPRPIAFREYADPSFAERSPARAVPMPPAQASR